MYRYHLAIAFILLNAFGCDDIIAVDDVSNQNLDVLAPADNALLISGDLNFSWYPINETTSYHVQIVTPDFENAQQMVLDSLTQKTNVTINLNPGIYEWRVRAENSEYLGPYTKNSFTVEE